MQEENLLTLCSLAHDDGSSSSSEESSSSSTFFFTGPPTIFTGVLGFMGLKMSFLAPKTASCCFHKLGLCKDRDREDGDGEEEE